MRRVTLLRVAAAIAFLPLAVIAADGAEPDAPPPDRAAFVDTIGVNVHLYYTNTAYADFAMVRQRLEELGIRHVRDGFDPERRQFFFDRVNSLAAGGVKSTLIACHITGPGSWLLDPFIEDAKNKVRGALDAVEGPNEPDLSRHGDWVAAARGCQSQMFRLAKDESYGAPLSQPVLGLALGGGPQSYDALGKLTHWLDRGTAHCYPGGRPPGLAGYGGTLESCLADARRNSGRKPVYATETGYHDAVNCSGSGCTQPPVSQRAAAIYVPRLFFEHARAGVPRTFLYELVDLSPDATRSSAERNFGLFESDWSYKPAAHALRNLIGLLGSAATPRVPLRYTLANAADPDGTGPHGPVRDLLLQKADGSWWLALWQDSRVWDEDARVDIDMPAVRIGVTLGRKVSTVTRYRPTYGSRSVGRLIKARSFELTVDDDVVLLEVAP